MTSTPAAGGVSSCVNGMSCLIGRYLSQFLDADKLIPGAQLHFKMALNPGLGEVTLNIAGGEHDAPAVVGNGDHGFGNALIDSQVLVVTQIEFEADKLIGHKKSRAG